jgi:integrase
MGRFPKHDNDLLFAVNGKEMSQDTLRMVLRRLGRDETPHGFRSTFKEWARSQNWADHLSEAALAHQDRNEVRAAYARSDLLDERRPMMASWASYLAGTPHEDGAR